MADIKIVIPMAGRGKRLGPLTQNKPKALVRIANKRLLGHVLDIFQELEKTYSLEYIFIIGYFGEQVTDYMKEIHPQKNVTYFVQEQLLGQSDAVYLAKDVIAGPILLTYCDAINEVDFSFLPVEAMRGVAFVQDIEDPRTHGVALVDADNRVTKLVEKPRTKEHRSALTGLYYFSEGNELIKAIETQIRQRKTMNNEYYLADAINILVENGTDVRTRKVSQWLDAGTPETIIETNAYLLQRLPEFQSRATADQSNKFIPPIYIEESAQIEKSVIGPNVSIGKNCEIYGSIIRNSIIDDYSKVTDMTLVNSVIGMGCSVSGKGEGLIVGDQDRSQFKGPTPKTE